MALGQFRFDPILKIDASFYSCLDLFHSCLDLFYTWIRVWGEYLVVLPEVILVHKAFPPIPRCLELDYYGTKCLFIFSKKDLWIPHCTVNIAKLKTLLIKESRGGVRKSILTKLQNCNHSFSFTSQNTQPTLVGCFTLRTHSK